MALQFTLNQDAPASAHVDCIVVGAFADKTLSPAAQALDSASQGRLTAVRRGNCLSADPAALRRGQRGTAEAV